MNIVYPPTIDWQFMFQRPHQMAAALARRGHRFYFCQKTQKPGRPPEPASDPSAPGVTLVHDFKQFCSDNPHWEVLFATWGIHHTLAEKARQVVFDHLDAFPEWQVADSVMMRCADVVLCTSEFLMQRAKEAGRQPVHVPNACDPNHWQAPGAVPHWLEAIEGPKVLFSGCLGQWVDVNLIERLAESVTVICVGVNWRGLRSHGKLHIIREQPYDALPAIFRGCDVGIIPFLPGQVSEAADPIKQYEYAAAGLPFIATDLPEIRRAGLAFHRGANDVGQWLRAIQRSVGWTGNPYRKFGSDMVAKHTWDQRAEDVERAILAQLAEAR